MHGGRGFTQLTKGKVVGSLCSERRGATTAAPRRSRTCGPPGIGLNGDGVPDGPTRSAMTYLAFRRQQQLAPFPRSIIVGRNAVGTKLLQAIAFGLAHGGPVEFDQLKVRYLRDAGEPGVGNPSVRELSRHQHAEPTEILQPGVGNLRAGEVQPEQQGQSFQLLEPGIRDDCVPQRKVSHLLVAFEKIEPGVGDRCLVEV